MHISETKNYTFGIFMILNYFLPMIMSTVDGDVVEDVLLVYFRIAAVCLCFGLLFIEYWKKEIRIKYYRFYWYFCLFFCISLISSYTILNTQVAKDGIFWVLNSMLSIVLLFILLDWLSFMCLMSTGFIAAYIIHMLYIGGSTIIDGGFSNASFFAEHGLYLMYFYGFLMIAMVFFIKDKEQQVEKITHVELFSGAIAHEINAPIASVQMIAMTLSDVVNSCRTSAVKQIAEDGTVNYHLVIPEMEYQMLFESLAADLLSIAKESKKVVDILLLLLKYRGNGEDNINSMRSIVSEIISAKKYTESKNPISFDKQKDFKFFGHKLYMKQVIINLLDNAMRYAGDEAKIDIWIEDHSLHIRDNGVGIQPKYIKNLFKPFSVNKGAHNHGIGLSFCGLLVNNMGGTIECQSEYSQYTEFIITLSAYSEYQQKSQSDF